VLACRFGEEASALELLDCAAELRAAGATILPENEQIRVSINMVRLRFLLQDAAQRADPRQQAAALIARFDADKNGYLTADELRLRPAGLPELKALDADGDEKVYPAELQGYLEMVVAPSLTGIRATVADDRDALFGVIDANGDGRLGAVELARAADGLRALDLDGDGAVDAAEIPAAMTVRLSRGRGGASGMAMLDALLGAPRATSGAPSWFVHMDLNGDGAVTPREFLGTPEQFSRLDQDNDGAITRTEVQRAATAE
jgi:Ca2+-binding EF-hand superfamily protein